MKKLITYTSIASFATIVLAISAPDKAQMIANEKDAWQAFKDKKTDEFQKMLAADYRGVYADGIFDVDKQMDNLRATDLKSFELSDFDVVFPDADTAVLTYKATITFVMAMEEGRERSGIFNVGSVWKMSNGAWHVIFHSDSEQEKPQVPAH